MTYIIHTGDNRDILKTLADNSIDAIVTDPPYGIDFLGKSWDANTGALATYQECLRVLKPGGHILAFGHAKTYHHLATTLESAGFEIRDMISWIYSQGMPKGRNLKPAHEPICLARRGPGLLQIDAARIPREVMRYPKDGIHRMTFNQSQPGTWSGEYTVNDQGGYPQNVIGKFPADYQKYYYCPKVSQEERQEYNNHPTVKPVDLMKYLIKLITPPGGTVLDPFNGSGTTGMAAVELGFDYIGCELDAKYVEISEKRIEAYRNRSVDIDTFNRLFTIGK